MQTLMLVVLLMEAAEPTVVWEYVQGDTTHNEALHGMALEYPEALFLAGEDSLESMDMLLAKFDLGGNPIWTYTYDEEGKVDVGMDVDVGDDGNLYFTGHTLDSALLLLKIDSAGDHVWDRRVALGHYSGHVLFSEQGLFVAGWYDEGSPGEDLSLFRLDENGIEQWNDFYFPLDDQTPTGMVVDSDGSVHISCRFPCQWCAWTSTGGAKGILPTYPVEFAHAEGIVINPADHVFLCGDMGWDERSFMLIKNDILGNFLWPDSAKVYDLGADEHCRDIQVDAISDCYLAGWQVRGTEEDAALVKTDSAGRMLWSWVYEMEGDQQIEGIEVDEDGYIYLAGLHHNGVNWDMLVMQVRQPLMITGRVTDSVGVPIENIPVILSGDTTIEVFTDTGGYYGIEVYNGGDYTVSPDLPGWAFTPHSHTYSPLAHREFDQNFSGEWTGVEEDDVNLPYPSWELTSSCGSQITLRYFNYPNGFAADVFDVSGRRVDKLESAGVSGIITWGACYGSGYGSGVYFIRAAGDQTPKTKRIVLIP